MILQFHSKTRSVLWAVTIDGNSMKHIQREKQNLHNNNNNKEMYSITFESNRIQADEF